MATVYTYTLTLRTVVHSDAPLTDDEAKRRGPAAPDWSTASVEHGVHVTGADVLDEIECHLNILAERHAAIQDRAEYATSAHMKIKRLLSDLAADTLAPDLTPDEMNVIATRALGLRKRLLVECLNVPEDVAERVHQESLAARGQED